jgi:hypothetical protein
MTNTPGKDIFESHYYEGFGNYTVTLHFDSHKKYTQFLNWWVLGQKPKLNLTKNRDE